MKFTSKIAAISAAAFALTSAEASAEVRAFGGVQVGSASNTYDYTVAYNNYSIASSNVIANTTTPSASDTYYRSSDKAFKATVGLNLGLIFQNNKLHYGVQASGSLLFDEVSAEVTTNAAKYETNLELYIKPKYTADVLGRIGISGEQFSFYALAGLGYMRTEVTAANNSAKDSAATTYKINSMAFAFGAGAEAQLMDSGYLFIEYVQYYSFEKDIVTTGIAPDSTIIGATAADVGITATDNTAATGYTKFKPNYGVARAGFRYYFSF